MKYSLADYVLSITPSDPSLSSIFGTISIGGEGSTVGSVSFSRNQNMWETTSFATGGYVHNKNLSKTGACSLTLSQLANEVIRLIQLSDVHYGGDYLGLTLALTSRDGNKVVDASDCYIVKVPAQTFEASAGNQTWEFTCGTISFSS